MEDRRTLAVFAVVRHDVEVVGAGSDRHARASEVVARVPAASEGAKDRTPTSIALITSHHPLITLRSLAGEDRVRRTTFFPMMQNKVIDLWGEPIEVAISSEATNHASCTVIQTSPPGGGTMVHTHTREDEVLVVLEGKYAFYNGETWLPMKPGEAFYGVRGRPHAYRNVGAQPGRMLVVAAPGGLDEYFEAVSVLSLPNDQARFDDISRMYGIAVLPPGAVPEPG